MPLTHRPLVYIPSVDGLRAAAIVFVLLSHSGVSRLVPGGFGVTLFFFISGFLITRQLLAELRGTGRINLAAFAIRRLLRLYPALLVMVTLGGLAFVMFGGRVTVVQVIAALCYGSNYLLLAGGLPSGLADDHHPFAILWSLAIEEHFYLAFPLFMVLAGRSRHLIVLLIGGIVLTTLWRMVVVHGCIAGEPVCLGTTLADRIAYGTDTRFDGILYGAVLAAMGGWRSRRFVAFSNASAAFGLALLLTAFLIRDGLFRANAMYVVQGIGLVLVIGWLLRAQAARRLRALLSWHPARLVGRLSYSLYLWHWVVIVCLGAPVSVGVTRVQGGSRYLLPVLVLSFGLACASYYLVERPTARLRRRFGAVVEVGPGRRLKALPQPATGD